MKLVDLARLDTFFSSLCTKKTYMIFKSYLSRLLLLITFEIFAKVFSYASLKNAYVICSNVVSYSCCQTILYQASYHTQGISLEFLNSDYTQGTVYNQQSYKFHCTRKEK